jgi:hypothetical protein
MERCHLELVEGIRVPGLGRLALWRTGGSAFQNGQSVEVVQSAG